MKWNYVLILKDISQGLCTNLFFLSLINAKNFSFEVSLRDVLSRRRNAHLTFVALSFYPLCRVSLTFILDGLSGAFQPQMHVAIF